MKKTGNFLWIMGAICLFAFALYKFGKRTATDYFLNKKQSITIRAVIIDKKNFIGNQPVNAKFSYSYMFEVNGKSYEGVSHDRTLNIGDSVDIEYSKEHPDLNRPLHPKE